MFAAEDFLDVLSERGVSCVSSVPCSFFDAPLRLLDADDRFRHVPAVNEGSGLAIAAGAHLGGGTGAVIAQNSGFGNLINPLTSLVLPYRIPVLVLLSMRGWPEIAAGEEQHEWMGRVVPDWLDSLGIGTWWLNGDDAAMTKTLHEALSAVHRREPAFVLVPKGTFTPLPGKPAAAAAGTTRDELVRTVADTWDESTSVFSTTGYMSRALFAAGDRPGNFYMQGSMGHAGSLALGAAMADPARRVVVLDGDGALLMHLGATATIGAQRPENLLHIVFDNGTYASTGAQPVGVDVEYARLAGAAGYRYTVSVSTLVELRDALAAANARRGPHMIVVRGVEGDAVGSRASDAVRPADMVTRFVRRVR